MKKLIEETVTKTTSWTVNIEHFTDVCIQFTSVGVTSGTGTLTIDASNDGASFEVGIGFINSVSATPATRVVTLATSGDADTKFAFLGRDFSARIIKITLTWATDGSFRVVAYGKEK